MDTLISRNIWNVIGKIYAMNKQKNGVWISIKGRAIVTNAFISDKQKLDVFISNSILNSAPLKLKENKELNIFGRFIFTKDECYLRALKVN